MPKFKNIRVKMPNGRSRTQRVQVLASGKYKFVKNTKRKAKSPTKSAKRKKRVLKSKSKSTSKGGRSTARIYIGPLAGLAAVPAMIALGAASGDLSWQEALGKLAAAYSGYDPWIDDWDTGLAFANYAAIACGTGASILASKTGLNRRLPKGVNI